MNDYIKQAEDFLTETNTTLDINYVGMGCPENWGDGKKHATYSCTLKNNRHSYTFTFYDSLHNTEILNKYAPGGRLNAGSTARKMVQKAKPSSYDVLACMSFSAFDPGFYEDFCGNFGYDTDSRRAEKTYNAVVDEWRHLQRLFTTEQLEKLAEIR